MAASLARLNSTASTHYYAKDNYYSHENGVANSSWFGKGAASFGLDGAIDPLKFKNLMEGKDPTGENYLAGAKPRVRVNQASGKLENHRAGVDVTFAPPKSVSIAALLDGRKDIESAHRKAVEKTLTKIEQKFSICRIGGRGEQVNRVCKNLIVARFEHDTSRSKDPQLHTHCVIISAVQKPDREWRRINNNVFWNNSKYINDYYLDSLKTELKKINVPLVEKNKSKVFEIEGYDNVILKGFSKQTEKIKKMSSQDKFESALKYQIEAGRDETKAQKYVERNLKLAERKGKGKEISREELKTTWNEEKDSLLNINVSEKRFSDDIIISGAGFFAKKSVQLLENELELTGLALPVSAVAQVGIGAGVHDVSIAQETYSFSASLVGGYVGGVIGEFFAGPVGAFIGDIVGAGIAQDIAENVHKYVSSASESSEQEKHQVEKIEPVIRKENLHVEESVIKVNENSDLNNAKGNKDMRDQNKEKFKEAESKKDYSKDAKIELSDKNMEKDKSVQGKEAGKDLSREEKNLAIDKDKPEFQKDVGEKSREQDKEREVKGASKDQEKSSENKDKSKETKGQDKDKDHEKGKEIDFDDWGRGK